MSPRVKIEEQLPDGDRIAITIEGPNVSEEKVIHLLNVVKALSSSAAPPRREDRLSDLIWEVIFTRFGSGTWFTSRELYEALREEGVEVDYRAVATYLLRFYRRGMLLRSGSRPSLKYRIRVPHASPA
ncbi:MAG: hypothetical protein DRJ56_05470 [Thermoprotei archaeon]|nr:MAG: hypothetical protein DRJ56_05470 [Thermoprotei archaeon]